MTSLKQTVKLVIVCGIFGAGICAYHNGWLIICLPGMYTQHYDTYLPATNRRQKAALTWWHDNKWQTEVVEIVCPHDIGGSLEAVTQKWLALVEEEKPSIQRTKLQTALFSENKKIAYLSFDRNPLNQEASMFDTVSWVEGLCTTLKNNNLPCTKIQLLVHHKPLTDARLDFSFPWPIEGFLHAPS